MTVALTNLIHGQAVLMTIAKETEADEKACRKALLCNAACGIAAPLVGGVAPSIGEESVAGVRDGGRSGLTSIAASVVYLISMFVWIVPFYSQRCFPMTLSLLCTDIMVRPCRP